MNEEQKKEVLAMLIADAEKVLNIHDEGPLEDDFASLKNYYTDLEEKILHSQGTILDLSGKEIIPSESFFIVDKERDMIYPFSLNDIPTLLSDGKNPYTSKNIDKEKIRKIQIVLGEQKSIQKIGGMLEVFSGLDKPAEIADSWEDINTDVDIERVRNLQQKAIKVIESKNIKEMCKQIQTFTKEEVLYLSSPILWGIYLVCVEDKYPEDEETIEFLESKGVKYSDFQAIQDHNIGVLKYLVGKNKLNINFVLSTALKFKNSEIVVAFALNNGAKPYYTQLFRAAERGEIEIVKLLISHAPKSEVDLNDMLLGAVKNGHIDMANLLLENGADIHVRHDVIIRAAVLNKHTDLVKFLIQHGANIDVALLSAADSRNIEIMQFLLENGTNNIDIINETLIRSSDSNNLKMIELLLQYGADIHVDNDEALLQAIINDNLPMVKLLVQNGANLHARDFIRAANSKEMKHYIKQHL